MKNYENAESLQENKLAEQTAKKLANALDRQVIIGTDLSFTVGNVTFGWEHIRDTSTLLDLADLIDYFDELDSGHFGIASKPTDDDGWEGWRNQSSGPMEKPQSFLVIVEPRPTVRKIARKVLLGGN